MNSILFIFFKFFEVFEGALFEDVGKYYLLAKRERKTNGMTPNDRDIIIPDCIAVRQKKSV